MLARAVDILQQHRMRAVRKPGWQQQQQQLEQAHHRTAVHMLVDHMPVAGPVLPLGNHHMIAQAALEPGLLEKLDWNLRRNQSQRPDQHTPFS